MPEFLPRNDLVRREDWEERLAALVNEWKHRRYSYGENDCGRFAQSAIAEITGVVLLEGMEWPRTWLGLAKFMIANGWESVEDTMNGLLPPMPVPNSRRGDIVSFEAGGELHLAVRVGSESVTPGIEGLVVIDPSRWLRAWKVG